MDRLALLSLLALSGCATTPKPTPATVSRSEPEPEPKPEPASVSTPAHPGVIYRSELEQILSQSPGAFLAHVDSVPTFQNRRFSGWRLNAFFPGDPRFRGVDLLPGDVVTRVNGLSIEQPEQFMQVWEGVRFRRDLTVEIVRDGRPRTLSFPIADDPRLTPPPASATLDR